jgi:hypothetical protein
MLGLLERCPNVVVTSEFWPHGLTRAGSDPAELLATFERRGYRLFDIDEARKAVAATTAEYLLNTYTVENRRVTTVLFLP